MNKDLFVAQTSVNDCGAACLAMMLNKSGKRVTLSDLKRDLLIDDDGVSAYEIIKLSKKHGINATGYKNAKLESLKLPVIAHVINKDGLQHFVVLLKVLKDKVLVADPASSIEYVNITEFKSIYTGIIISFDDGLSRKSVIDKTLFIKTTALTMVLAFITVVTSYLYTNVLKGVFASENAGKALMILLFFLMTSFIKEIISFIRRRTALKFELLVDKKITLPVLRKLINLPHNFYYRNGSGDLISKVNDLSYVKEMIYVTTETLLINVILIIGVLTSLILIKPPLFFISGVYVFGFYIINRTFSKKYFYDTYLIQHKNEVLNAQISDCVNGITTIKNLKKEKHFYCILKNIYDDLLIKYNELTKKHQNKDFVLAIYVLIYNVFLILFLTSMHFTIYDAIFVFTLEEVLTNSLTEIFNTQLLYANFKSCLKRLKTIDSEKEVSSGNLIKISNISFRNVSYGYQSKRLFDNVNFNINDGDLILIKGNTGCGKSTLFKMLNKQVNDYHGSIFINGIDIKELDDEDMVTSITYVDQKVKLFNKTIKENVYFGTLDQSQKIERFLKAENINENIVVDNLSGNVSGGQAQKIIIAQALANSGSVIIFDETTNQIDANNERKILNFIKREYKDKIIVLISHRNSNTDLFNKIISFENGKVKMIKKGG